MGEGEKITIQIKKSPNAAASTGSKLKRLSIGDGKTPIISGSGLLAPPPAAAAKKAPSQSQPTEASWVADFESFDKQEAQESDAAKASVTGAAEGGFEDD